MGGEGAAGDAQPELAVPRELCQTPPFSLHLAEHKHSLMGWRQTRNHGSSLFSWAGDILCVFGKDANRCSRDSSLREDGAMRAAKGYGRRSTTGLHSVRGKLFSARECHFGGAETAYEFGSRSGKNELWEPNVSL